MLGCNRGRNSAVTLEMDPSKGSPNLSAAEKNSALLSKTDTNFVKSMYLHNTASSGGAEQNGLSSYIFEIPVE